MLNNIKTYEGFFDFFKRTKNTTEFKTPKDLADFVLKECGDMDKYKFNIVSFIDKYAFLEMESPLNIERVYLLFQLLRDNFGVIIKALDIAALQLYEIPDGYLEKMTGLETLYCYNNHLTSLPKLPSTLKNLKCYGNELYDLPELPKSLKKLECKKNPGYQEWMSSGKIKKFLSSDLFDNI